MKIKGSGIWEYSEVYRDLLVAKEWGLDPLEFWDKPKLARAFMIAMMEVQSDTQEYERK